MKARVKATGKIVEVKSKMITSPVTGESLLKYVDQKTGISYFEEELFFPKDLADDPDYWERLKHQYAGMAMQGIMSYVEQITPKKVVHFVMKLLIFHSKLPTPSWRR